ncbi:hypothetical protein NLI96_g2957 [Meripilus lineatus]|uniref:Uncharacterized protein n=1 Tax=Meripilus lineatus TaxID=2056292 RepID=A0AAD5V7V6_9APHY|nr:hypothetical protein NLI96_g2957 [Physisporinus lineatus]
MGRVDYVNIYHEQTNKLNHGHPLYNPDYQQPEEPGGPLEIGDVGLLYRRFGTFIKLFNVGDPPKKDSKGKKYWSPFDKLAEIPREGDLITLPRGAHHNDSITDFRFSASVEANQVGFGGCVGYSFSTRCNEGALLVTGSDAASEYLASTDIVPDYMVEHFKGWCDYAKESCYLKLDDFDGPILIYGFIKTSQWSISSWGPHSAPHSFELGLREPSTLAGATLKASKTPSASASVSPLCHTGPIRGPGHPQNAQDQCIFISYYHMKGPDQLPDSDSDGSFEVEMYPPIPEKTNYDVGIVVDYILENSEAQYALASHFTLEILRKQTGWTGNLVESLRIIRPAIDLTGENPEMQVPSLARNLPFSCVSESAAALANAGALARPAPEDPESAVSGNESDDPPVTENVHIKDEL